MSTSPPPRSTTAARAASLLTYPATDVDATCPEWTAVPHTSLAFPNGHTTTTADTNTPLCVAQTSISRSITSPLTRSGNQAVPAPHTLGWLLQHLNHTSTPWNQGKKQIPAANSCTRALNRHRMDGESKHTLICRKPFDFTDLLSEFPELQCRTTKKLKNGLIL